MRDGQNSSSSDDDSDEESTSSNGNESTSSSSEVTFETQPSVYDIKAINDENTGEIHDIYTSSVQEWTERVPIGMNLCPWAKLSHKDGRIKYVACPTEVQTPLEASEVVWREIERLLGSRTTDYGNQPLPPWSTTLVICPHVAEWNNDYTAFENFVTNFGHDEESSCVVPKSRLQDPKNAFGAITLVPFHPNFLRWKGLPETISTGSRIRCHKGLAGFAKSPAPHNAVVVDLIPRGFGRRRIKVRFDDDIEQCIPVDWVVLSDRETRPPLPDNLMHRAPYPTIHILRNRDLQNLSIHDISRLKRRNAKRMLSENLGWESAQRLDTAWGNKSIQQYAIWWTIIAWTILSGNLFFELSQSNSYPGFIPYNIDRWFKTKDNLSRPSQWGRENKIQLTNVWDDLEMIKHSRRNILCSSHFCVTSISCKRYCIHFQQDLPASDWGHAAPCPRGLFNIVPFYFASSWSIKINFYGIPTRYILGTRRYECVNKSLNHCTEMVGILTYYHNQCIEPLESIEIERTWFKIYGFGKEFLFSKADTTPQLGDQSGPSNIENLMRFNLLQWYLCAPTRYCKQEYDPYLTQEIRLGRLIILVQSVYCQFSVLPSLYIVKLVQPNVVLRIMLSYVFRKRSSYIPFQIGERDSYFSTTLQLSTLASEGKNRDWPSAIDFQDTKYEFSMAIF